MITFRKRTALFRIYILSVRKESVIEFSKKKSLKVLYLHQGKQRGKKVEKLGGGEGNQVSDNFIHP